MDIVGRNTRRYEEFRISGRRVLRDGTSLLSLSTDILECILEFLGAPELNKCEVVSSSTEIIP